MATIYNNNSLIPGNGADVFGDKLVGNQFVDGVSQFTLGNFEIKSNNNQKDSRDFSLGNFSEPISLETLNITSPEESRIIASNRLEVFINYNRSNVTNFTLYGSLRERLRVAVTNIVKNFPAAVIFKKTRTWLDYLSGETATNINYDPNINKTNLNLNVLNAYNPFNIEYSINGNVYTDPNVSPLRNLTLEYEKYSLFYGDKEYPLTFLRPTTGTSNTGVIRVVVEGDPFSGTSTTSETFYIRPNTLTTEEVFDSMEDMEKFLVERTTNPIYTATFDQPRETSTGSIIKSSVSVTWPSSDNWNLIIDGSLFTSYLRQLYDIADTYDSYKTNLVSRFLTTASLKEFDTYDEKVDKILKIYGRSFDQIKKYIDGLAYMATTTYDGLDNIPNELLKNFAQTLGWKTPSAIKNEGLLDSMFKRNTTTEYEGLAQNQTPTELNYELYRRLLANTAYLFKSKGTRRGIEFMLRFVGAPEALIEFNEHVYVAGQPLNMKNFKDYSLKISGGTYTEEVPVFDTYFSAATGTFPPIVITGYTFGYETVTQTTNIIPEALPVDKEGYPTVPRYGEDSYFQSGAGWFEETIEHQGKKVIDYKTSVFTGNTPFIKTKLNQFSYGEPYLQLYRKFPDSKLGFPIVRTVDNKKSWVRKDSHQRRYLNLPDSGTNYQTENDKLVVNVKNVDIFLNIGQGLEWDVWNFSKKYSCPFGPNALSSPYPGVGGPDWTEIVADASKLSFFEFAQKFWTVLINVKNRLTIDDGHAGGYPTLLSIYLDYLKSDQTCGIPSNQYTYEKMVAYVENMGDYWVRLLEQLVPSTTIWQGGIKYENSIFHRYKYAYKHEPLCNDLECFGSFVNCCYPITNNILVDAVKECGGLAFSGATWQNKITLGGTVYTGNTYYSSTTITDIPSTDIWLNDMVSIVSGITADVTDPNHVLTYYLINDNNTPVGIPIDQPNCIVIQGPCSGGTDLWNYNNGSQPNCFKSDICLNLQTTQAAPLPNGTDIWAFYDTTSTYGDTALAAKTTLDDWVTSLGTDFTGNVYHMGVATETWLEWARYPISGGTINLRPSLNPAVHAEFGPSGPTQYLGFNVFPDGTTFGTPTNPSDGFRGYLPMTGVSRDVLTVYFIDEAGSSVDDDDGTYNAKYHYFPDKVVCTTKSPPDGAVVDWSETTTPSALTQPYPLYVKHFDEFMDAFNNYNSFKGFVYPIIYSNNNFHNNFPLHVYGALSTSTVLLSDLVENPTVTAAGGSLSAITLTNPYTGLTGTNDTTAYTGPGLENFGFGANYSLGATACNGLICGDIGFNTSCIRPLQSGGLVDSTAFFTGPRFQEDLLEFLQGNAGGAAFSLLTCEICVPICYQESTDRPGSPATWKSGEKYSYGDTVLFEGNIYIWQGEDGISGQEPDSSDNWVMLPPPGCVPFLGGNNFRLHDDCADFSVIPGNPEVSGTTITTYPEIFKDGISNIGAQDCFESQYMSCEELTNPCGCKETYGQFDISTVFFEVGDVVCCPTGGQAWIRIMDAKYCEDLELFIGGLCDTSPSVDSKCWRLCDSENSGAGLTSGGRKGESKERVLRKYSPFFSNYLDPCDPEIAPPDDDCGCENVAEKNLDLDFYLIEPSSTPDSVLNFVMAEEFGNSEWTTSLTAAGRDTQIYKAEINVCNLGDKFTHYFRVYHLEGAVPGEHGETTYGDYKIDFNVNPNCNIEFYYAVTRSDTRLYMHIPPATMVNATIEIVNNPLVGSNILSDNIDASDGINGLTSLTFRLGSQGSSDPFIYHLFRAPDSNHLTDNGANLSQGDITPRDRYWGLCTTTEYKFRNVTCMYGALSDVELNSIVGETIDGTSDYRFNWEMELSCEGNETTNLTFTVNLIPDAEQSGRGGNVRDIGNSIIGTPLQPGVGGKSLSVGGVSQPMPPTRKRLYTTYNAPFSNVGGGTDMSSPIINQNESAAEKTISISNIQNSGNLTRIPISETITDINKDIDIDNYKVISSEMFIVRNTNPLQKNRVVNYNFPQFVIDLKDGRTYETFIDNGIKRVKLTWLDDFTKNSKSKINIEFISKENKKRFEQDLKLKNIGQGVEFLPHYTPQNTRPQSTVGKTTFVDLRDWATRSLGNVDDFSNSRIIYGSDNLVKRFEIGPTFTTHLANSQYKVGLVPIGDPKTEFLVSTMGSFDDYLKNQTGTTSSAITITLSGVSGYYSGYTNLSGYTNNEGLNLSPDFVFDISLLDNKMSLRSGIALSDPTFSETRQVDGIISGDFKLIGDRRNLRPAIPTGLLNEDDQLFLLPREDVATGGNYFSYKVPKTQKYRVQYKSCINFEYFDEGWCTYLDTFRTQSNNLFPVNDYDFKQLINSSIIYAGGSLTAPNDFNEGNVVNDSYASLGITNKLCPIFGYNPNNGIKDFYINVYVERQLSGTTATTVIGNYIIGNNSTQYPNANDYLTLPLNQSDKFTNLYECSGLTSTTKIFEKKFIPYIDTGCIELNKDDEIRLRINLEWENTTKNNSILTSSGLTASTISLKVGTDYDPITPERPWFRVINKECNVGEGNAYLYWQANETGPVSGELFSNGTRVPPTEGSEVGKLIFVTKGDVLGYITPNIRVNNLQNLNYFDTPDVKNYSGNLKLIPTSKKTNRWVESLEKNRIKDFRINSSKVLNVDKDMEILWNVPVPVQDNVESISLDDPQYTYMVESRVKVKGTTNTFTILNTYKPEIKSDTIKDIKVNSSGLVAPESITYTSSRPLEERTIGFENSNTIIRERVVAIESVIYDKNTPTADNERTQYCKCGDSSYIAVPSDSTVGCNRWCCVNSYQNSTYYPCGEKTINEWAEGLNLTRVVMPAPTNGIIRRL